MEDETFQWVCMILLAITLVSVLILINGFMKLSEQATSCPEVIDTIYEHCIEEVNTTITTTKGSKVNLQNVNGECIIK